MWGIPFQKLQLTFVPEILQVIKYVKMKGIFSFNKFVKKGITLYIYLKEMKTEEEEGKA